jgi:hypothetical protein
VNYISNFNIKSDDEVEILRADILEFIQVWWKYNFLAGAVGALLGFGGRYFFGYHQAELILLKVNLAPSVKKTGALNATIGGLLGAGFLMLAFLLGHKVLRSHFLKNSEATSFSARG